MRLTICIIDYWQICMESIQVLNKSTLYTFGSFIVRGKG